MRNKRFYKHWFLPLVDILIAGLLTYIIYAVCKKVVYEFYYMPQNGISSLMWDFWVNIRYRLFGTNAKFIMGILVFVVMYLVITYRKTRSLVAIIDETEIMASGDLNRLIEIKTSGDIRNLVKNINSISKQLKDVTLEERRAQNTKNDLITNVSHDLRTPLTSIMGYLEVIDTDKYKDEVELRYYANIAYEKAKSLSLLINDLFELTKMQNSTINLDKSDINLVELVGQVVAYFEYQFKSANMKSRINFSNDKLIVNADAEKLVRAFENLLSNAIKYGKDGFYVDVTTKIEEEMAVVQVINYGQSISAIDLPYIFDRFYRVEKSRNSNIGGSGLGLAITKNIIELHKGSISAYSDEERTIFEVRIPVK